MNKNKKAHLIILIIQLVFFVIALSFGIVVIMLKNINWGYSMAFFVTVTFITLVTILISVNNCNKWK